MLFKKVGAYTLLTVFVIPPLLTVGATVVKNKEEIAVIKSEKLGTTRQLERIESKLDLIQQYLLQRK